MHPRDTLRSVLGHVLRLAPSVLRLQFLREDSSPYMRTAAIRLEKKLFWKRFQIRKRRVCFGSLFLLHRMYSALMGPWKLEPPNLLASISEVDALKKSPEHAVGGMSQFIPYPIKTA